MGTMITLGIGSFEIDWGKNHSYKDHAQLYKFSDIKEIDYYYANEEIQRKEGLSRKLKDMKRRLELLGYSPASLKSLYEEHLDQVPDYYQEIPLTYNEFHSIVSNLDISKIELDNERADYSPGKFLSKYLFKHSEFNKIHNLREIIDNDFGLVFENMDPYLTLRILAENPVNDELDVNWYYADLVESGWVEREDILENIGKGTDLLVVTEGSSDTNILKRALHLLYPDIEDFFCFIDMKKNYPFTGDGNLFNFCKGLSSIRIKNDTLIIFDNDVAGNAKYELSKSLDMPKNMHVTTLPSHDSFNEFKTIGPNGVSVENINSSAVAIECFLDHDYETSTIPSVRWTSYNEKTDTYQGKLIDKDSYTKKFLSIKSKNSEYNFDKLIYLIDYLYSEWIECQVT